MALPARRTCGLSKLRELVMHRARHAVVLWLQSRTRLRMAIAAGGVFSPSFPRCSSAVFGHASRSCDTRGLCFCWCLCLEGLVAPGT